MRFCSFPSGVQSACRLLSERISRSAQDLSFASAQVSSAASVVKYTDGTYESVSVYFPEIERAEDGGDRDLVLYYDARRTPCSAEDAEYTMSIRTDRSGLASESRIVMQDQDGETLYELNLRYPADGRDES